MMAEIFLVSGWVMAVMILLFFSNLFITGQRERIAVERLLGRSRKSCAGSILTGILVLAAAGSIIGSAVGCRVTKFAGSKADAVSDFDTSFSNSAIQNAEEEAVSLQEPGIVIVIVTGGGLLLGALFITAASMQGYLKKEPLWLLGEIEE